MRAAVLIITWNAQPYIKSCLESLLQQSSPPGLIQIVDNASTDATVLEVESYRDALWARGCQLVVEQNRCNLGFTQAANQGLRIIIAYSLSYDIAFILNQDTILDTDCLQAIQEAFCRHRDAGAVGCKIFYPNRSEIQHAGGFLERPRMVGKHYGHHQPDAPIYDAEREVDFVTGAAMALRLQALKQVGFFNELFSPGYYEDVDLCVRLKAAGWRVLYNPRATLSHVESASFTNWHERLTLSQRNRLLFAAQYMSDPKFRSDFEEAELDFLYHETNPHTLRALSLAYGRAMITVGLLPTRLFSLTSKDREDILELTAKIRQAGLKRLYECIDADIG